MKVGNSQGSGPYHIQAEINMIPLIDVALVLLIIFMVISPILVKSQLDVRLPSVTSDASQAEETAVKVNIDSDGRIAVQGTIVERSRLEQAMKEQFPTGHQASLLIEADKEADFQDVVYVMDLAKRYKVEKLGVAVLPEMGR